MIDDIVDSNDISWPVEFVDIVGLHDLLLFYSFRSLVVTSLKVIKKLVVLGEESKKERQQK